MSMKRTWPISSRDLRFRELSISASLEVWRKYLYTIFSCGWLMPWSAVRSEKAAAVYLPRLTRRQPIVDSQV
jgi:hypothetical protein